MRRFLAACGPQDAKTLMDQDPGGKTCSLQSNNIVFNEACCNAFAKKVFQENAWAC